MALCSWWLLVRHRLVWKSETRPTRDLRFTPNARAADKQPWTPTQFTFGDEPQLLAEQPAIVTPPTGHVDQLGRLGLLESEERLLTWWLGSKDCLLGLLDWVKRAHKRMEMLQFPNSTGDVSVAMLRDVHPRAVQDLERLLRSVVGIKAASVDQVRSLLHQRLTGVIFPRASTKAELEELLACARNLNWWLASNGTLPCGCGAITQLDLP